MTTATVNGRFDRRFELAVTMLLAVAAVATAWASYQSTRWRSEQAKASGGSIAARVESTREASVANRNSQVDVALFTQWVDAYVREETELADFYRRRFRDEFRPAFQAWVATRPRFNRSAPLSPFAMPEYKLAATEKADDLEAKAAAFSVRVGQLSSGPTTTRSPSCCSPCRCSSPASARGCARPRRGRSSSASALPCSSGP